MTRKKIFYFIGAILTVSFIISIMAQTASAILPADTYTLVPVSSSGVPANGDSILPAISKDGRYVSFYSGANNLVDGDIKTDDFFMRDIVNGSTIRLNVGLSGEQSSGTTDHPQTSISNDGRYVTFSSAATNLVANDTNNREDVFVRDTVNSTTSRVSVGQNNEEGNQPSLNAVISGDGRYVIFASLASNFGNPAGSYYIRDLMANTTAVLPLGTAGTASDASLSNDGRYITYISTDNQLVSNDNNNVQDVFIYDRTNSIIERLSIGSNGQEANSRSLYPFMSDNGRYVAFASEADNLSQTSKAGINDIFVRDLQTGQTTLESIRSNGQASIGSKYHPTISDDGRYVSFDVEYSNIISGDENLAHAILIRDRSTGITKRVSPRSTYDTLQNNGRNHAISADGSTVVFGVFEPADMNYLQTRRIYIRDIPGLLNDTSSPVVTGIPDREANNYGWYNSNVVIDWQVTDPTPSSGTPSDPPNTLASVEGANVNYVSTQSCDPAGNCATGSLILSIDTIPPRGTFVGSTTVVRLLGQRLMGTATDATSGVAQVEIISGTTTLSSNSGNIVLSCNSTGTSCTWDANPATLPFGSQTLTLKITDKAGNIFTTTKSYTII